MNKFKSLNPWNIYRNTYLEMEDELGGIVSDVFHKFEDRTHINNLSILSETKIPPFLMFKFVLPIDLDKLIDMARDE